MTDESTLMWALLLIACPPIFEASASRTAGQIGAVIYDKDADDIERLAYRPIGALLRCCYLFCFLTAIVLLGRGGYDLLPDDGWIIAAIMSPFAAYVYWAGTAYRSSITALAQREQWQKRSRSRT